MLHCRDNDDGVAATRTFELSQNHKFTQLAFNRHCFTGSLTELEILNNLPKIVSGITAGLVNTENTKLNT